MRDRSRYSPLTRPEAFRGSEANLDAECFFAFLDRVHSEKTFRFEIYDYWGRVEGKHDYGIRINAFRIELLSLLAHFSVKGGEMTKAIGINQSVFQLPIISKLEQT